MKSLHYFIVLVLCCFFQTVSAQCWDNTPQTATTDWRNYPAQSQNDWNWTDTGLHDFYLNKYNYIVTGGPRTYVGTAQIQLYLPYHCPLVLGTAGCNNSNTNNLHDTHPDSLDIYPEDGWELVIKNFGYCPSAANCQPANAVENPYYAIYNRHTGRMKIYMMLASAYDKQGMYMKIHFTDGKYKRALFSHVSPYAKALPDFDSSLHYKVPNHYELRDHYWVWADVQMGYDFCNCEDNNITEIEIQSWLLSQANVNLVGEGTINQSVFSTNGGTITGPSGIAKPSFFKTAIDGINAGQEGSLKWTNYKNKINSTVNDNVSPLLKTSMALAWWLSTQQNRPDYYTASESTKLTSFVDVLGLSSDSAFKALVGAGKIDGVNQILGGVKNIASQLPHVGWIIGLADFFSQGGNAKDETNSTAAPISFDVNLRFSGDITELSKLPPINFYTPGSPNQPSISKTPFYNNTLGVVTILKQPEIEYVNYISTPNDFVQGACGITPPTSGNGFYDLKYKHYRLKEPIKYVVNPASNLEVVSIDAAYILEYSKKGADPLFLQRDDYVNNLQRYTDFVYNAQTPALFDDPNEWLDSNIIKRLEQHTDMEIDYYMKNFDTANLNNTEVKFRVRTKYTPLNCFANKTFILHSGSALKPEYAPRVMVKLFIKLKHKTDPDVEPVTQTIQWDLGNATLTSNNIGPQSLTLSPKYESSCSDAGIAAGIYPIYPKRVLTPVFPTIFYSAKNVTVTSGSSISNDLYARETITIEDGVSIGTGIIIHAGKDVKVHPNNQFQDVILRTGLLNTNFCNGADISSLHANGDEIAGVCSNPQYQARIVANKKGDTPSGEDVKEEIFPYRVFPNPSIGIAYASYVLSFENKEPVSITVMDMLGREVLRPLENVYQIGEQAIKLDMKEFEAGIYFVNLKVGDKRYTERLILTK